MTIPDREQTVAEKLQYFESLKVQLGDSASSEEIEEINKHITELKGETEIPPYNSQPNNSKLLR